MYNENTTSIAGHVGRAPEFLVTKYGNKPYARFSVCVSEYWPNSRNVRRKTWFNCVAFGVHVGYIRQKMQKGSFVEVQGSMEQCRYTDKEGYRRTSMKLNVSYISVWSKQMLQVQRDSEREPEEPKYKISKDDYTPEVGELLPGQRFFNSEIDTPESHIIEG